MKFLFLGISVLFSQLALADAELKITSFNRVSNNDQNASAEACGTLTGLPGGPHLVRLTTDYNTKNPGVYYTWVGETNVFCAVVTTYRGIIQAQVEGANLSIVNSSFR